MANYYGTARTNYFHVTDEEAYQNLFAGLRCGDDEIEDFTETDKDGRKLHGFVSKGSIDYCPDEESDEYDFGAFLQGIQELLPPDEVFVYMETGAEKLCYVHGVSVIVTRDGIQTIDLRRQTEERVNEYFEGKGIKPQPLVLDY